MLDNLTSHNSCATPKDTLWELDDLIVQPQGTHCGSWLASDAGNAAQLHDLTDTIASKLAPTIAVQPPRTLCGSWMT